jgi:hypothetical protein
VTNNIRALQELNRQLSIINLKRFGNDLVTANIIEKEEGHKIVLSYVLPLVQ